MGVVCYTALMRLMIALTLAAVVTVLVNRDGEDETGLFELVAVGAKGVGYLPSSRREFPGRIECEDLAKQLQLTTYSEWRCNRIKESP